MRPAGTKARVFMLAAAIFFILPALRAFSPADDIAQDNTSEINLERYAEDTLGQPTLKQVLKELHEAQGIYFLYADDNIGSVRVNRPTSKTESPEKILRQILLGAGLDFRKINENTIVIMRLPDTAPENDIVENIVVPTIRGRVVDTEKEPLPGASVLVKGTSRGAIANQQGYFRIDAKSGETLLISNVGYQPKEVTAGPDLEVSLLLNTIEHEMREVTITALGITRDAKSLGYSATRLSGDVLSIVPENNMGNILTGLVAGVNSSAPLTGPGGSSRVTIRGNSSLSFDNQPLYVVNGIPVNNDNLGSAGKFGGADFGDGIASINPDDIGELQVLKGGAAAALYGQRGRNGVILINTKSIPQNGRINIAVNSNTQLDFVRDFTNFQEEYGQGFQGNKPADAAGALNSGLYAWGALLDGSSTPYFDGQWRPYKARSGSNLVHFYNTGWRTQQTIALGASNAHTQWRVSLGDLRSKSVYPNAGYNRHTLNTDLRYVLSSKWSGHTHLQYSKEIGRNRPNINDAPGNGNFAILFLPPNVDARFLKPGYDENGWEMEFNDNAFNTNPFFAASRFKNNTDRDRVWGMSRLRYQAKPWLYLQGRLAHDFFSFNANSITPTGTAYKPEGTINLDRSFDYNETNADFLLGIDQKLGESWHISFAAGANLLRMRSKVLDVAADGLAFPFIYSPGTASNQTVNSLTPRKNVHSVYGSLLIDWKETFYLTITDRNDWSSTLPPKRNSYNYPSAAFSYLLSKHWKWRALDQAKMRIAYSRVGGDAPLFATRLYYNTTGTINGAPIGGLENEVPNSLLEPLQVREFEWGMDASFFDKRLFIDIAWYRKQTLNDIVSATVSVTSGFQSALLNVGKIENKGIEWLISGTPVLHKKFSWTTALNFANNQNKVVRLSKGQSSMQVLNGESRTERAFVQHITGLPFSQIMVYDLLRDANGLPILNNAGLQPAHQLTPAGTGIHPVTGGWLNKLDFGVLEFQWLIDYKFGAVMYSGTNATAVQRGLDPATLQGRTTGIILQGVDANGNAAERILTAQQYFESLYRISALHVYNADFIKFRSFSFTWKLPSSLLEKWNADASLSLVGRNLFYILRKTPHIDPEANYTHGNAQGLEYASLPSVRSIGLNLQINFR